MINPYYIVKKALSESAVDYRNVNPLALIQAQQYSVDPTNLITRNMDTAISQLTNYAVGNPQPQNYMSGNLVAPQPVNINNAFSGQNFQTLNNKELEALFATSSGYNSGTGTDGACNAIARSRTLPSGDNNIIRILNSPCLYGGIGGNVDVFALIHKLINPIKWKGSGKFLLSDKKYQNLFNPDNIGKPGKPGGTSLASG